MTSGKKGPTHRRGQSLLSALATQLTSKYVNVAIQLAITAVLARLLSPEQFGTIAIVTVFTNFFAILSDLGVGPAIVQFRELDESDMRSLFSMSLIFGILLAGFFCAVSLPISTAYGNTELVPLFCTASLAVLFGTFNMVPNGLMLRERRFKSIGIRLVVASLCGGSIAVAGALAGMGSYALVLNSVVVSLVVLVWNVLGTRIGVGDVRNMGALRKILRYSAYQGGFGLINYFARNLDNLLIGYYMGPGDLGYYDKAYKLMQYPNSMLSAVLSSVLQPYLVEYAEDTDAMYDFWIRMSKFLALIGFWVTDICYFCAAELVDVMYGEQWGMAVPVFSMLALSAGIQMVNSTSGAVLQSLYRTDYLFRSGLICTAISVVAILAGILVYKDLATVGLLVSLAYYLHFLMTLVFLGKFSLHREIHAMLAEFAPLAATAMMTFAVMCLVPIPGSELSAPLLLLLKAGIVTFVYAAFATLTRQTSNLRFLSMIRSMGRP